MPVPTATDSFVDWDVALTHQDRLLMFVDETGGERMSDPNHPVFGLGGCAIHADRYDAEVAEPWRSLKRDHFGGADLLLHAAKLDKPTSRQLDALVSFFASGRFFRIAAVVAPTTRIDGFSAYEATAVGLLRNLAAVLTRSPANGVSMVFDRPRGAIGSLVASSTGSGPIPQGATFRCPGMFSARARASLGSRSRIS